jgi:hypothetical protein
MLRTCSEPDMTQLFSIVDDIKSGMKDKEDALTKESTMKDTKRLVRSLENLDQKSGILDDLPSNEVDLFYLKNYWHIIFQFYRLRIIEMNI